MELGQLYFFTATITGWRKLLAPEKYKTVITDSLAHLVKQGKIAVYGFVIMPNHIHILWELLEPNGKELPHASFLKYTSHRIQKDLRQYHPQVLDLFRVDTETRAYQFWQRDSLAVQVYSPDLFTRSWNTSITILAWASGCWPTLRLTTGIPLAGSMKPGMIYLPF